jgi:hypothetical protein
LNSHRENVKTRLKDWHRAGYTESGLCEDTLNAEMSQIADEVFDALGITEDEQDVVGGYFMIHAGAREKETMATSTPAENRKVELDAGAKYTRGEFKGYCKSQITPNGWYVRLETPVCTYAQLYSNALNEDEVRSAFAKFYYPLYLSDFCRVARAGREGDGAEQD